jgi:hypothetical protein
MLAVRPSHFEMSLFSRAAGKAGDHLLGAYALSLGLLMQAQVLFPFLPPHPPAQAVRQPAAR